MRRFVRILLSVVLGLAIPAAVLGAGFAVTMSRDFTVLPAVSAHAPRPDLPSSGVSAHGQTSGPASAGVSAHGATSDPATAGLSAHGATSEPATAGVSAHGATSEPSAASVSAHGPTSEVSGAGVSAHGSTGEGGVSAHGAAGGAGRIPVAVLLGANGSVATDVLGPFDVLGDSGRFDVYTVSVHSDPVALSGGLTVVPDFTADQVFDGAAPWPRIVVVPAFTDPGGTDEALLRALIERAHDGGALVVSVCAGARVLAQTDVLDGRRATSFWSDIDGLRGTNPRTDWVSGVRWVQDGDVMTTAGVSSGIIGALHLVQQFAGAAEAERIGARLNYPGWVPSGTAAPAIPVRHVSVADYPYAMHAVLPWFQPTYGLGLTEGVDEIDVAAVAELYGGVGFTARVVPVAEQPMVTTAHGLRLLATPAGRAPALDRLVVPGVRETKLAVGGAPLFLPQVAARVGDSAFDPVLRDMAAEYGRAVAVTAAKYVEYPVPALPGRTGRPWRIIGLVAGVVVLGAAGAAVPFRLRRRPPSRAGASQ